MLLQRMTGPWLFVSLCITMCLTLSQTGSLITAIQVKSERDATIKNPARLHNYIDYFPLTIIRRRERRGVAVAVPQPEFTQEDKDGIVALHNEIRSRVGATNMVRMEWNTALETEAKRSADDCDFNHPIGVRSIGGFDNIGQNLYLTTYLPTEAEAIESWEEEELDYIHSSFGCSDGETCGHYTQSPENTVLNSVGANCAFSLKYKKMHFQRTRPNVSWKSCESGNIDKQMIWAETTAVGCAIEYCDPITSATPISKGYLVVCEYGPAGNMLGVDPYKKGSPCSQCPKGYKYCVNDLCSLTGEGNPVIWTNNYLIVFISVLFTIVYCYFVYL